MISCPCCGAAAEDAPDSGPDRLHRTGGDFEVAICPTCGVGITLPRLPAAELAGFYPQSYGPYDAASGVAVARISTVIQRWQGDRALRTPPLRALAGMARRAGSWTSAAGAATSAPT